MNTCQCCGIEYMRHVGKGRPSRFCSRSCQGRALYLSNQAAAGIVRMARSCAQCGELVSDSARTDAIYCSIRCRELFNYNKTGATQRLRKWGLSVADYDRILATQGGACAVDGCTVSVNENGRRLHVDHDHACCPGNNSCGACIRGLLCGQHNVGIGMFNDDPRMLRAAAEYLERSRVSA